MTLKLNGSSSGSVSIDAPASTTSGADITFALPVADGTAGQVLQTDGSGNLSWVTSGGLTEADQWRVTASFTSNADPVTSNWERNDNSFDKVGTGMSESSGIFTFPSTGIWKIDYQASFNSTGNTHYGGAYVKATTDNSSYARIGYTYTSIDDGSGTWYGGASGTVMFDVTNVSTHKVCFEVGMDSATCMGSSTYQVTGLTFIKMGAT